MENMELNRQQFSEQAPEGQRGTPSPDGLTRGLQAWEGWIAHLDARIGEVELCALYARALSLAAAPAAMCAAAMALRSTNELLAQLRGHLQALEPEQACALNTAVLATFSGLLALTLPGVPAPRAIPARRILLVEDNCDASATLCMLLRADGHTVTAAFDGNAGLALARREPFDVLVCDIGLPGIDGLELVIELRKATDFPIPFAIAVSGRSQAEYRMRAVAAGFGQYFVKPIDIDALLALVGSDTVSGFIDKAQRRR